LRNFPKKTLRGGRRLRTARILDTHALYWYIEGDPQLSATAQTLEQDASNEVLISPASYWEMAIKISMGKWQLNRPYEEFIDIALNQYGFRVLPILPSHTARLIGLPFHHKDPSTACWRPRHWSKAFQSSPTMPPWTLTASIGSGENRNPVRGHAFDEKGTQPEFHLTSRVAFRSELVKESAERCGGERIRSPEARRTSEYACPHGFLHKLSAKERAQQAFCGPN
jgi:PIN domain nuclease of toxin-antitoxin system